MIYFMIEIGCQTVFQFASALVLLQANKGRPASVCAHTHSADAHHTVGHTLKISRAIDQPAPLRHNQVHH